MKDNFVAGMLVVVLALSVISAAILTAILNGHTRRTRQLQGRMAEIQNTQNVLQSIANDAVEYGNRNPAIMPLLKNFGLLGNVPTAQVPVAAPKSAPIPNTKTGSKSR